MNQANQLHEPGKPVIGKDKMEKTILDVCCGQPVITELIRDLLDRDKMGTKKYGTTLRTNNGRDALNDALQEALDLVMYLKQAIMERDSKKSGWMPGGKHHHG